MIELHLVPGNCEQENQFHDTIPVPFDTMIGRKNFLVSSESSVKSISRSFFFVRNKDDKVEFVLHSTDRSIFELHTKKNKIICKRSIDEDCIIPEHIFIHNGNKLK